MMELSLLFYLKIYTQAKNEFVRIYRQKIDETFIIVFQITVYRVPLLIKHNTL